MRCYYEFQVLFIIQDDHPVYQKAKNEDTLERAWYSNIDLHSISAYSMVLDEEANPHSARTCLTLDSGIEFTVMMAYQDVDKLIKNLVDKPLEKKMEKE